MIELGENYNGVIKLYNIEGKLITTITANKGFAYLETSKLVPGIYFMQTLNEEKTRTAKFIINH